ncbi:MAG TPA: CsbD family protein [Casimicrobiaceae bacterium]
MNWDRLQGQLKQRIGRIKQQWGKMTADTLRELEGRHDELTGKIQEAYGISRDDALRQARNRGRAR